MQLSVAHVVMQCYSFRSYCSSISTWNLKKSHHFLGDKFKVPPLFLQQNKLRQLPQDSAKTSNFPELTTVTPLFKTNWQSQQKTFIMVSHPKVWGDFLFQKKSFHGGQTFLGFGRSTWGTNDQIMPTGEKVHEFISQ